jgi:hypothetical protein
MKRALSIAAQCILFMLTFLVGSLAPSLHLIPMERLETSPAHYFVLDGLFCMGLLYIIFLIIAAVTRRLPRVAAPLRRDAFAFLSVIPAGNLLFGCG